jgi:hypothetical protein
VKRTQIWTWLSAQSAFNTHTQFEAPPLPYLELFALFAAPKLGEAEDGVLVLKQASMSE